LARRNFAGRAASVIDELVKSFLERPISDIDDA